MADNSLHDEPDKNLPKIDHQDKLLVRLLKVWPKFSPEGKHLIEKMIELVE